MQRNRGGGVGGGRKSAARSLRLASRSAGAARGAWHEGQAPPASRHALHNHAPHVCRSAPGAWWVSHFAGVVSTGFAGAFGGVGFRVSDWASSSSSAASRSSVRSFLDGTTWVSAFGFFGLGSGPAFVVIL